MSDTRLADLSRDELVRRIEAARRRLSEEPPRRDSTRPTPPVAARGVSGRNVSATVAAAKRLGLDRHVLERSVSFALASAERPDAWISWPEFNELLERIGELAGDEGLWRLGEQALESPLFRAVGIAAGAFLNERDLLEWIMRLVFREGSLYFRGVDGWVEARGAHELRVVWDSRGAVYSGSFALAMAGIVKHAPRMVGRAPAEVEVAHRPDRVTLDVTLAARPSPRRSRLRGRARAHLDREELRALTTELVETNQRLNDQLEALRASMSARRELERRLTVVGNMDVVGRFAGSVAHELNNLLTVLVTIGGLLRDRLSERTELVRDVELIQEIADRAASLTRELRALARGEPSSSTTVDLRSVIEDSRPLLTSLVGPRVTLRCELDGDALGARVEPSAIARILVNLAINARDAMPDGGTLTIDATRVTIDEAFAALHPGSAIGDHVRIVVKDDGVGMNEEVLARVFEPYFSTRPEGDGRGIGLATVFGVVRGAGGTVWADSTPGEGATFRFYLPRVELEERAARTPTDRPHAEGEGHRLLFIDDNALIRSASERMLSRAGFEVAAASSGDEALARVKAGLRPHVVVSDVVMPGLRGIPLAEALRAELGPVPILFISGHTDRLLDGELGPLTDLLAKPFRRDELLERIAALLGRATSA